jgi:hypothetical protein
MSRELFWREHIRKKAVPAGPALLLVFVGAAGFNNLTR